MLRIAAYAIPRFILPAVLFFGVQAFAQFEIAPDHFDSTDQKAVTRNTVKPVHNATSSSNSQASLAITATAAHPVRKQAARRRVSAKKTPAGGNGQNSIAGTRMAAARRKRTSTNNAATASP